MGAITRGCSHTFIMLAEEDIKKLLESAFMAGSMVNRGKIDKRHYELANKSFTGYYNNNRNNILALAQISVDVNEKIYVKPFSKYTLEERRIAPSLPEYRYDNLKDYEGKILGEALNGKTPAYRVRISGDGIRFMTTTINKTDVRPLSEKYLKEEGQDD